MLSSMMLLEDVEDFVDVSGTVEQWFASLGPCSAADLVDRYERTVEQVAVLEVEAAYALNVPGLVGAAQTHADATRRLAAAQASMARTLLRC